MPYGEQPAGVLEKFDTGSAFQSSSQSNLESNRRKVVSGSDFDRNVGGELLKHSSHHSTAWRSGNLLTLTRWRFLDRLS